MSSSRTCCPSRSWSFRPATPEALAGHDVVFLALPHGQSAAIAAQLPDDTLVIDCGADFRLDRPGRLGPLLRRRARRRLALRPARAARPAREARGARRIAVPGCYPTVSPSRSPPRSPPGLVEPDVVVVAASGTSGAGKAAKPHLLGSEVMGTASAYGVGGVHRHTPEIIQNLSLATEQPVRRQLHPAAGPDAPRHPRHLLREARARPDAEPPARLRQGLRRRAVRPPAARGPVAHDGADARRQHRRPAGRRRPDAGRLVAVAAVDNLTKGTAAAAIKCANLALGLPETTGLPLVGVAP